MTIMRASTRLWKIADAAALKSLEVSEPLPRFDAECLRGHATDAHWVMVDAEEKVIGRCSLWWRSTPTLPGHRLGLVGHYASADPSTGSQLLELVCRELRDHGCTLAVGPMDGSTWRNYRFVTGSRGDPPFFLEPVNPRSWPAEFEEKGFRPMATYSSSIDERMEEEDGPSLRAAARMADLGVKVHHLSMDRFEEELRSIHPLITTSFQNAFLYQPITESAFVAQYQGIRPYVQPSLAFIATHANRPVGFIFTVPDSSPASAGRPGAPTAVIKTLAVLPGRQYAGLGVHLTAVSRRAARDLGFRRLIHALMQDSNSSRCIRSGYTSPLRRYTLFARPL